MSTPLYGWYGDDFTGATDTLACLAEAGQRALLFPRVPTGAQLARAGELDAIGIAGATRAMAPDEMRAVLDEAGAVFASLGVRVMHYKCCSTFDSAPEVGNLAVALATLRPQFPQGPLAILGGQPNIGRFCLFSHLFAAAGAGGAVHRLDRHPTMSIHPVTPMAEADLRLHLAAQGLAGIAALHYPLYAAGEDAVASALRAATDAPAVLLDVARAADLTLIGPALWRLAQQAPLLCLGPSSVAQALASAWPRRAAPAGGQLAPADGPVFALIGSLSPVSRAQADASHSYEQREIAATTMLSDSTARAKMLDDIASLLRDGRAVMLRTGLPEGAAVQAKTADALARASAEFLARLLAAVPLRRIGIAGGDTSSRAVLGLDLWALAYRRTLAPGVTLCAVRSENPALEGMEMMLKGGQMGPPDLFETLLAGS
jgi:3-oxoisoapionate kinase